MSAVFVSFFGESARWESHPMRLDVSKRGCGVPSGQGCPRHLEQEDPSIHYYAPGVQLSKADLVREVKARGLPLAHSAGLVGVFKAILSDGFYPNKYANRRIGWNWGRLVNMTGQDVALHWNDLRTGRLVNAIPPAPQTCLTTAPSL